MEQEKQNDVETMTHSRLLKLAFKGIDSEIKLYEGVRDRWEDGTVGYNTVDSVLQLLRKDRELLQKLYILENGEEF